MKFAATLSVIPLLLTCSSASAERMQEYSFPDYGFSFKAPARLQMSKSGTADHGYGVFLDRRTRHLQFPSEGRRYISVFAAMHWDGHDVAGLLAEYCTGGQSGPAPNGLAFSHARSGACREDNNGRTDVYVISIDGMGGDTLDHIAQLHTNASHFEADLKVFRGVLRSTRIFPPP